MTVNYNSKVRRGRALATILSVGFAFVLGTGASAEPFRMSFNTPGQTVAQTPSTNPTKTITLYFYARVADGLSSSGLGAIMGAPTNAIFLVLGKIRNAPAIATDSSNSFNPSCSYNSSTGTASTLSPPGTNLHGVSGIMLNLTNAKEGLIPLTVYFPNSFTESAGKSGITLKMMDGDTIISSAASWPTCTMTSGGNTYWFNALKLTI